MQERRLRNIQLRLSRLSQSEWIAIPALRALFMRLMNVGPSSSP
mgnify:CR=1 FL=1